MISGQVYGMVPTILCATELPVVTCFARPKSAIFVWRKPSGPCSEACGSSRDSDTVTQGPAWKQLDGVERGGTC